MKIPVIRTSFISYCEGKNEQLTNSVLQNVLQNSVTNSVLQNSVRHFPRFVQRQLKALGLLQAFENSTDWVLLS